MTELSVVVPIYNEELNVKLLYEQLVKALKSYDFEIIFVDDGSRDGTLAALCAITDKRVKIVKFARNYGQTSAMSAGIEYASGKYIATIDGDLQNDPSDIAKMLVRLKKESLDLVAGKRRKRQDGWVLRKIPSKVANYIIRTLSGVKLSDYGCTLKVFTSKLAKKLELYGELHRFIPILASLHGAKIAEVDVKHHARKYGVSKYGISRTVRVVSDLTLMLYFIKYRQKPMHLFGTLAQVCIGLGGLFFAYLLGCKLFGHDIGHRPLLFISILLLLCGVQFLTTGFLAELLMRTNYASKNEKPYTIDAIYVGGDEVKE